MVFVLLAPYNDSMHLGQGFNSFLQIQCINNAVQISDENIRTQAARAEGADNVSQVVSYSSRFVERISDIVRSMNISAGSSIKSGTIEVSGNSLTVDEAKFSASDMNAVVSVKVVNQTTQLSEDAEFIPLSDVKVSSERFFDLYGDCYISGFIEGGDFHGLVSMKILNASKKSQVQSSLKGQLNSSAGEFTLNEGVGSSELNEALSETETTITVNWSGGGQIKAEAEEWSLESLFKAAAGFPARVANCPQRTWAILTRYDNNRSFLEWAESHKIRVPQFANCGQYTSDLLDSFMEYKNNLLRIQAVLANPVAYTLSAATNPVNITIESLITERKGIKLEMRKIVDEIDQLNRTPGDLPEIEARSTVRSPEVWATRLPVLKTEASSLSIAPMEAAQVLRGFSFSEPIGASQPPLSVASAVQTALGTAQENLAPAAAAPAVYQPPPAPPLCPADIEATLTPDMREFLASEENRKKYSIFRFDRHVGSMGGGPFNDAVPLRSAMVPVKWPKRLEVHMRLWNNHSLIRQIKLAYDQVELSHGSIEADHDVTSLDLGPGEHITHVRLGKGSPIGGVEGIGFIAFSTSAGQKTQIGDETGKQIVDYSPFTGCVGLKGFHGGAGDVVDRLGPIWGTD